MVQRRKVERKFIENGWYFVRHGGNHDIWSNGISYLDTPNLVTNYIRH